MNIGIAGAGLLGRLLAFQLARAGHRVHAFDPAAHAEARGAAGWTAAGMLSPVAELECADENVFALGLRSMELWPEVLAQLEVPVECSFDGSLLLAHRGDEGAARRVVELLEAKIGEVHLRSPAAAAPRHPTPVDRIELRELEPAVSGPAHAWLLPGEGRIHTMQAMQALAASAHGVQWHWGTTVESADAGVLRAGGTEHRFDWVFDVRGTGARPQLPVRGVRGEIFWLQAPGVTLRRPLRLLHPRYRVYLVPRAPDLVVVGASEIESEDRSPVSLRSTVELLAAAHSVVPELAEARVVHSESNLRPALPDNLPRLSTQDGLTRINGLFRHGWLIAPALVEQALQEMRT
ncbi:FAD-dependent oxidoreductase [Ramlibacter sp. USB13]|uniref:FAD-dependent oxidoreductase n=1 Tax=Ramlibacter cellulosilyticus TaxID=2764187 RepID=A0A923MVI3_9BURK|nr:FAD-dependent oxidoreductase [Ramlibacter cellulosilyticus]MBC5786170.1 FAD-dependent oxidoreductase [Ramlibacter cellulosilyticus]